LYVASRKLLERHGAREVSSDDYLRIKKTTPYYNAVRRVAFPSTISILISLLAVDLLGTALAFLVANPTQLGLVRGVTAGVVVFLVPTLLSAQFSLHMGVKRDPLFFPRRVLALSLFGSIVWVIVLIIGAGVSRVFGEFLFPSRAFYLGLFVVLPLRSMAVFSMSTTNLARRIVFALSDPVACSIGLAVILTAFPVGLAVSLALATVVSFAFTFAFLIYIDRRGIGTLGVSPLLVFRAFLKDWLDGDFSRFESCLEVFGVNNSINICVLSFKSKASKRVKGTLIVPNFHAGPFLNIGSSALPYMIQHVVRSATGGVAAVAHGITGHELNLVSQRENEKVIEKVRTMLAHPASGSGVSPIFRSKAGSATATCQVFGKSALVTMTTAPHDTEDIDFEVGQLLRKSTRRLFKDLALVDAHNSLGQVTVMSQDKLNDLAQSAKLAMKSTKGVRLRSASVGVAHTKPRGISLKEGMGLGGITVFWITVGDESYAYVVFDSNNMASGLRERILGTLGEIGAVDGEVMTSDTHMVNGLVSARLGYYPIGAATDPEVIVASVRKAAEEAKKNIEPVNASLTCSEVQVRTLGPSSLTQLTSFVLRTARLTFATLFPVVFVIAIVSLVFLI
jgi:putative membrane protein